MNVVSKPFPVPVPDGMPERYITTTSGMRGMFPVHIWWNPEGFWEPWVTGSTCLNLAECEQAAKDLAEMDDLTYRPAGGEA